MVRNGGNVERNGTLNRFWHLAAILVIFAFGLAATTRTATASDACNVVNSLFGVWQTFAPGDPEAYYDTSAGVFETGETLFYQAQTFGSSQAERDRDPGTSGAGLELYRIDTGDTLNFEPDNGLEVNVSGNVALSASAQFEIFMYGATPPGTGSVRSRLICYGANTSVSSIAPASGPVAGGNDVVITGTGLAASRRSASMVLRRLILPWTVPARSPCVRQPMPPVRLPSPWREAAALKWPRETIPTDRFQA